MASRQTIIKEVKVLLKAGALPREFGVEEADYADLVNAALTRYSKDVPLVSFADYSGDSETFDFPLPEDWDDSLSFIREVEYPQGRESPPFCEGVPGSSMPRGRRRRGSGSCTSLLKWATRFVCSTRSSTRPTMCGQAFPKTIGPLWRGWPPRRAVTSWPAASPSPRARPSRQILWTTRASLGIHAPGRELERKYQNHLGRKEGEVAGPAGASLDWDVLLSLARGEYFTHGASEDR